MALRTRAIFHLYHCGVSGLGSAGPCWLLLALVDHFLQGLDLPGGEGGSAGTATAAAAISAEVATCALTNPAVAFVVVVVRHLGWMSVCLSMCGGVCCTCLKTQVEVFLQGHGGDINKRKESRGYLLTNVG